jgi:hypothetical protein
LKDRSQTQKRNVTAQSKHKNKSVTVQVSNRNKTKAGERMKKQNTRQMSIARMLRAERAKAGILGEPHETDADEAQSPDPASIRKYRFRIGADGHTRLPGDDAGDPGALQTQHGAEWPFEGLCISVEGATMPIERIGKEGRRSKEL